MRPGRYWIFFRPCRMTRTRWPKLATARLASTPRLSTDQMPHGIKVRRVSGQPEHPQPSLGLGEGAQLSAQVHIEVVPDQHDVPAGQLAVRGDQQVPVLGPGERLGLALAAAVGMQPVDQTAAVAGPVAGQPGDRDVSGAAAADPDDRGGTAPPPGPGPGRPQRLAALVFEDDPAAEGRRRAFIRGQVSFFHTSTAPSSRSIARRAPSWQVQPRRRSRYQIPGMVYCSPNFAATRSRTRASVHRWSAHPAASGPASSAASSAASCCSSSRHCAACPREASPAGPPACQACRHRRTDRSLTRSSSAITAAGTRCSNLLAASSRTCSRRLRPSAVSPPPCAYRMHPAYRRKQHASAHRHHQLKSISCRSCPHRRRAARSLHLPGCASWSAQRRRRPSRSVRNVKGAGAAAGRPCAGTGRLPDRPVPPARLALIDDVTRLSARWTSLGSDIHRTSQENSLSLCFNL
jgi:hypothetical protein